MIKTREFPLTINKRCPICGSENFRFLFNCKDYFSSGEEFPIVQCTSCGMKISGFDMSEQELDAYYQAPSYVSHSNTSKGLINRIYHLVRGVMLRKKGRWVSKQTNGVGRKILDLGSGTGYFLNTMRKMSWEVQGIERSSDARSLSKTLFGIEPHASLDDLIKETETMFDAITLWHVLEHLQDPRAVLESLSGLLSPDGVLVVALPNADSVDAAYYREEWAAYDVPRHLWHFTPKHFTQLAESAGFDVEKCIPMYFDSFYISILSEQNQKKRFAILRGLFVGSYAFVISLFRKKRAGSIAYVLKKRS